MLSSGSRRAALLIGMMLLTFGCASRSSNPAFDISRSEAMAALKAMETSPGSFELPVVMLGGYLDPGFGSLLGRDRLRLVAGGQRVIGVSFFFAGSFDECRRDVIAAVEREFPSSDPQQTIEVDAVGFSMGGVVARYCAIEKPGQKRLKIRRLYTVSSPHLGSDRATDFPAVTKLHRDLRKGSAFLADLETAEAESPDYEIVPYVRAGDWIVGSSNAAPRGRTAFWVPTPVLEDSHFGASLDPRILGDIARRLRRETPFTLSCGNDLH